MKTYSDLRIVMDSPTVQNTHVFLNGEDISSYLNGINIDLRVNEAPVILLSFVKVKIDAELKAKLLHDLEEEGDDGKDFG